MSSVIRSWFPSVAFANTFAILILAVVLADEITPRLGGGRGASWWQSRDRGSFLAIQLAAFLGVVAAIFLRYRDIGVGPPWIQVLALVLLVLGAVIREWAVILLGRFFARTVEIEPGHRLITAGPYRWIRHPAYTGMVLADTAIALGLGTWAGAVIMLVLMLIASLYRIRVEERTLLQAFTDEYRVYMERTWRLFPGW
jgi:protein-S-isoprenylcysteine O-methyltransferase Ste14